MKLQISCGIAALILAQLACSAPVQSHAVVSADTGTPTATHTGTSAPTRANIGTSTPKPTTTATVASADAGTFAVVRADNLHVRSGPGFEYRAIGFVYRNQAVPILAHENGWTKINIDSVYGWVNDTFIQEIKGGSK